ncbi:MAG: hypothetical protein AAB429_00175 [Patescibacteria group bacterium]
MIESKDILFFVLAFCVLWFTLFVSWLIWQVAMILKNVNDTISDAREKLGLIEKAIVSVREKFEHMNGVVAMVGKGIERIVEYAVEKKKAKDKGEI